MKIFTRLILLLVLVAVAGAAVHFVLFRSLGQFVWHLETEPKLAVVRSERSTDESAAAAATATPNEDTAAAASTVTAAAAADESPAATPKAAVDPAPPAEPAVPMPVALFNAKDLKGWESIQFGGEGDVFVNEDGHLELGFGAIMTGAKWSTDPPAVSNYEIELDAMRLDGNDFFCALTFPVKDSHATFIIGGWGGGLVGISSIDDLDASENETMNIEGFEDNKWIHVKLRVTDDKIEAWIDERQMVDVELEDRKISLRPGDIELCKPLGIACYSGVRSQYRNVTWLDISTPKAAE